MAASPKRRTESTQAQSESARSLSSVAGSEPSSVPARLDQLVHERVRLAILSALAVNERLSFTELKSLTGATDGNLSVHSRKLEDAGYVSCHKGFEGRVPRTDFALTAAGRQALERYLDHMERLIRATRSG